MLGITLLRRQEPGKTPLDRVKAALESVRIFNTFIQNYAGSKALVKFFSQKISSAEKELSSVLSGFIVLGAKPPAVAPVNQVKAVAVQAKPVIPSVSVAAPVVAGASAAGSVMPSVSVAAPVVASRSRVPATERIQLVPVSAPQAVASSAGEAAPKPSLPGTSLSSAIASAAPVAQAPEKNKMTVDCLAVAQPRMATSSAPGASPGAVLKSSVGAASAQSKERNLVALLLRYRESRDQCKKALTFKIEQEIISIVDEIDRDGIDLLCKAGDGYHEYQNLRVLDQYGPAKPAKGSEVIPGCRSHGDYCLKRSRAAFENLAEGFFADKAFVKFFCELQVEFLDNFIADEEEARLRYQAQTSVHDKKSAGGGSSSRDDASAHKTVKNLEYYLAKFELAKHNEDPVKAFKIYRETPFEYQNRIEKEIIEKFKVPTEAFDAFKSADKTYDNYAVRVDDGREFEANDRKTCKETVYHKLDHQVFQPSI